MNRMDRGSVGVQIYQGRGTKPVRVERRERGSIEALLLRGHLPVSAQHSKTTLLRDVEMAARNQERLHVRTLHVEELRARVKAGMYAVDSRKLAEKILLAQKDNG